MAARINGLFVGMLEPDELAWFENEVREGRARRAYRGGAGVLGLAKVEMLQGG
jgi:hypothetical protein